MALYTNDGQEIILLEKYNYELNSYDQVMSLSDDNGDEIFKCPNGLLMTYRTDDGELKYHVFPKDEVGNELQIIKTTSGGSFYVDDPYFRVLSSDTYNKNTFYTQLMAKIVSITDANILNANYITSIGAKGVQYANNLTSLNIPHVQKLDSYSIGQLSNLEVLDGVNITSIATTAHVGNTNLRAFNVNNSILTTIDNGLDDSDDDYMPQSVVVRKSSDGKHVYEVGANKLVKLSDDNIYVLNNGALTQCKKITDLYFKNLTSFSKLNAFLYKSALSNLVIENDVLSSIDNGYGVRNVVVTSKDGGRTLYEIGDNVQQFHNDNITAFTDNCFSESSLSTINIDNEILHTYNDCVVLNSDDTILCGCACRNSNLFNTINEHTSITSVAKHAMRFTSQGSGRKDWTNNSIVYIDVEGIRSCNLTSLTMNELTGAASSAFHNYRTLYNCYDYYISCPKLKRINTSMFHRDVNPQTAEVKSSMVYKLHANFPVAEYIGNGAFYAWGATEYDFPSVTSIDQLAFQYNQKLSSLHVNKCTSFGNNIIKGFETNQNPLRELCCGAVLTSYISANYERIGLTGFNDITYCGCHCKDGNFWILKNGWEDGYSSVLSNDSLIRINIHNFITWGDIGKESGGATNNDIHSVSVGMNVTEIDNFTFANCEMLSSVQLPLNLEKIGNSGFDGCKNLLSINIPANVTEIGEYSFDGCKKLISIVIPEKVTVITEGLFETCDNLTKVEILSNITNIEADAFSYTPISIFDYHGTVVPSLYNDSVFNMATSGTPMTVIVNNTTISSDFVSTGHWKTMFGDSRINVVIR